jgi:parallel beta-helix repeat protein
MMIEQIQNFIYTLAPYFPLGAIGFWRWSVWLTKKVVAKKYRPIAENGYRDTLSLVTPVYNEDPEVFERALKSWARNKPDEIIAVIDHTDKACIEKFKKFQEKNASGTLIITKKPGKRSALASGIKASKYNMVAVVDSDTLWDPKIKNTLLFPFSDPTVGGVGPRQDVLNANTLSRKLFNIHIDQRYFDEITYLAAVSNALTCLSGRTAVYRKKAIIGLIKELENETFLGVRCISGDDKCLTRLVQEKGWKTRYQGNVKVLTPGVPDLKTLVKQHIRWTRNSYRSDIKSLMGSWIWKREKFLVYHMLDRFTQPFTLVLGPIYLVLSIAWGHWLVALTLILWWHFSRGIKLYPHLRHHPSDLLILPFYIFTTYMLAVLKIYAMITIGQQGWITRWDKSRLESGDGRSWMIVKSVVPHMATLFIVVLLGFGIVSYKNFSTPDEISAITTDTLGAHGVSNGILSNFEASPTENGRGREREHEQSIFDNLENGQFGFYAIRKGDTLREIALRYGSNLSSIILANENTVQDPNDIKIGQGITILASELRSPLNRDSLAYYGAPNIFFDESKEAITIDAGAVTVSEIHKVLDDETILQSLSNKEWLLKSNIFIKDGATLIIDGDDVSWLKLQSDENNFVWIDSKNGNILINNTRVTSWDASLQSFDRNHEDGRSFVSVKYNSRMDIIDSEIAFLGYGRESNATPISGGGFYGVSWKIPEGTFRENLVTGSVINSKIHNNYFGIYTFGATGMVFKGNTLYDNVRYGLDFHDDSNNFIIENNVSSNNGSSGIIISKYGFSNTIRKNISYGNGLHGIMLHDQSNNNLVENNSVYGNIDGIVVYDSHNNVIRNNKIKNNKSGVRANVNSSGNHIEQNEITENQNGVFVYDAADNNFVINNLLENNRKNIYIRNAYGNMVE